MYLVRAARVAIALAMCGTILTADVKAQSPSACLPQDDNTTALVDFVKNLITANSARYVAIRDRYGLDGLTTSDVAFVRDTRTCQKAVDALDLLAGVPVAERRVHVVRAGNKRYIVYDPTGDVEEYSPKYIFDSSFKFLGIFKGS